MIYAVGIAREPACGNKEPPSGQLHVLACCHLARMLQRRFCSSTERLAADLPRLGGRGRNIPNPCSQGADQLHAARSTQCPPSCNLEAQQYHTLYQRWPHGGRSCSTIRMCTAFLNWPTVSPRLQALAARAVQILQYILMAVVMFGDHIFPVLGVQPPELYQQVKDKKFGVIMGAWLIGAGLCAPTGVSLCGPTSTYHLVSKAAPITWWGDFLGTTLPG